FKVIYIAVSFMMLFTAFNAGQNLMTQIFKQLNYDGLGQCCIFSFMICFALSSVVAPQYYNKVPTRACLLLGSTTYVFYVTGGALATLCDKYQSSTSICNHSFVYGYSVATTALSGLGSGFFWLCQATYVNACADEKSRGVFNGTFLSIYSSSQILSGVIATLVLGRTSPSTFYITLIIFGTIATIMFGFVQPPTPYDSIEKPQEPQVGLTEALKSIGNTLTESRYYFLFMAFWFTGVATTFYAVFLGSAVATSLDTDDISLINQNTGFVFIVLAVGMISAGLTIGKLADSFDKVKLLSSTMFLLEAALLVTVLACVFKSYSFAVISGALWGFGETSIVTMINVIIGSKFNSNPKLFSAYRIFYCTGGAFVTLCSMGLQKEVPMFFIMVIAAVLLVSQSLSYY
ncbi:MAG: MFS transporter, partial [Sphingobacteriales bacterium]